MTTAGARPTDDDRPEDRFSSARSSGSSAALLGPNAGEAKIAAVAAGAGALALGVVSVYLLGRRKGRQRPACSRSAGSDPWDPSSTRSPTG